MNIVKFPLSKGLFPFLKKILEETPHLHPVKILDIEESEVYDWITIGYVSAAHLIFLGETIAYCRVQYYRQKEEDSIHDVSQPCD